MKKDWKYYIKTTFTPRNQAIMAAVLAGIMILVWIVTCSGCASAPPTDLAALHNTLAEREGTRHYDDWSPEAQAEWDRAWARVQKGANR